MKIISKIILIISFILLLILSYLSLFGVETSKFNDQIKTKIEKYDKNLNLELKKIKIILNPFKFRLEAKTIGPKLIDLKKNNVIALESLKAQITLKSFLINEFSLKNLEISTKSLKIKDFISFLRSFNKKPELFILENFVKKGYLIADIKFDLNNDKKINENFEIKGFFKDVELNLPKKLNIEKLNFIFELKKNFLSLKDINFSLNNLNFNSDEILVEDNQNNYSVKGKINNKILSLNNPLIDLIIKNFFPKIDLKKIQLDSENSFSFNLNKKFKLEDIEVFSKMNINELTFSNKYNLNKLFPEIKEDINFINNKVDITYKKNFFSINGNGKVLFQKYEDDISYSLNKRDRNVQFKSNVIIKKNPLNIDFLNYEKDKTKNTVIDIEGANYNDNYTIDHFSIKEENDLIKVVELKLNKFLRIKSFKNIEVNFFDRDKVKNDFKAYKEKKNYFLEGSSLNADNLIENLLLKDDANKIIFDDKFKFKINLKKVYFDKDNFIKVFTGDLTLFDQKIISANLSGNFLQDKKITYTVKNLSKNKRVATLLLDNAEPLVKRYKFIKGFEEGVLDFKSNIDKNGSSSNLRIYDFKLKELPLLTKILTLASLQGIADILSGEGIRFDEFEMDFSNEKSLMTINEMYAIGPAISILMDGYIERNKIVSLRGTLVPATTINKVISSIPILGKILVGSKTGEGVFGVSFKIKGPPGKLETTVNPIKTLTPRFITRTLEKIKKAN
jgi:hypothetical protein